MMNIKNIKFRQGIKGSSPILLENKKHIAFYGHSNVGKSSSINKILNRKKMVKTSATPGKTKEINFFEISLENNNIFFVDLPGYGYAKLSKTEREKIRKMILWYLLEDKNDKLNILVIDIRRGFREFDKQMLEIFENNNKEYIVLVNKVDKLNQKEKKKAMDSIYLELKDSERVIMFSAKTGFGLKQVWDLIQQFLIK